MSIFNKRYITLHLDVSITAKQLKKTEHISNQYGTQNKLVRDNTFNTYTIPKHIKSEIKRVAF